MKTLTLIVALLAPSFASAALYEVSDVVALDGDTVVLSLSQSFQVEYPGERPTVTLRWDELKVRLSGINTPESFRPKCEKERELGVQAKLWLQAKIDESESLQLLTDSPRERGKFGRVLGRLIGDGTDLNQELVDAGLADPYSGGRRDPQRWCLEPEG